MGSFLADNPLGIFALLLLLSVVTPPLVRRLGLPDLVGLILGGVLVGPHGFAWLRPELETVQLLSDVGVVYLLFIAGLEIDLGEFRRIGSRSLQFGLLTFTLPMLAGAVLALGYGYPVLSAVLIGSILASHTPLGYPIVRSYGATREEAVTVAIGGTVFTDIAALVVLALCMSLARGSLSPLAVTGLVVKLAIYAVLVIVGVKRMGRALIRHSVDDDGRLFVAVLLALFLSALGAELAGVEKIVGAFLAGLAVNALLPEGRLKEQVIVLGASVFIPIFFIDLGLLLDVPVFLRTMVTSVFAVALILLLVAAKGLASWLTGRMHRYDGPQILTLWSLSLPQVAATLAATFVGFRAGVLDERVLNSVLAMMVVTATLGPMLTKVAMARLAARRGRALTLRQSGPLALARRALRVLVPVANPSTEAPLLALGGRLSGGDAEGHEGTVLPLAVVSPQQVEVNRATQGSLPSALSAARGLLHRAEELMAATGVAGRSLLRVDDDVAGGIARAALEQGADLVVVGVGPPARLGFWFFGDMVAAICRQAHCPVVMARLMADPGTLRRVLVPVKDTTAGALEQFQLAERFVESGPEPGRITLLHVHDPRRGEEELERVRVQLQRWIPFLDPDGGGIPVALEVVGEANVAAAIRARSRDHDLVILRSQRRIVEGLPIPASDRAAALMERLRCSTLVISDPLH